MLLSSCWLEPLTFVVLFSAWTSMLQAYVKSHINTAIYVLDFLKHAKARGGEKAKVEELIAALSLLHKQVRDACHLCVMDWC